MRWFGRSRLLVNMVWDDSPGLSVGVGGSLGAVVDAEFGHDRAYVGVGGFGADVQSGGDFGVAVPGGKQFEDVALALGEAMWVSAGVFAAAVGIATAQLGERCWARRAAVRAPSWRKVPSAVSTASMSPPS